MAVTWCGTTTSVPAKCYKECVKKCSKCCQSLPFASFNRHPRNRDGRFNICKDCTRTAWQKRREYVEGWRDKWCLECGEGPFIQLTRHISQRHDRTTYVAAHGVPVDSDDYRYMALERVKDRIDDGVLKRWGGSSRRRVCKRGHRLAGSNIMHGKSGRKCRKCNNMMTRERRRKRSAALNA